MIPQSPTHAAIGFIAEEGKSARSKLERFLNRIGLKPVEIQSARIPCYSHRMQPWRRISGCQVYLVGDAAAQVKVTTVGGLVTGLRGAKAAASAILGRRNYAKELRSLRREAEPPSADQDGFEPVQGRRLRSASRLVKRKDHPFVGQIQPRPGG